MSPPTPRPEILAIAPYKGGESRLAGVDRVIKLSANEGAFGPPPAAAAAYAEAAATLHRYPDGFATALRQAIGARFGLDPGRIVCGAGSDDLIYQLALIYGGHGTELLMSEHGFGLYDIVGRYAGCAIVKAPERHLTTDVDALLAAVTPATRLVFIANPNNPTGTLIDRDALAHLRRNLPADVLLVLDAAYAEYVTRADYEPGAALVEAGDNTVMLRTFSKMWGLGGARLGWAYAPPAVVDALNRVRSPFNVSVPANAAGIAALSEPGWVERCAAHNVRARATLVARLAAIGLPSAPSETNFILVDLGSAGRAAAADATLRRHGLIVRPVASYGLPAHLRITVGTTEEVELVAAALEAFTRSNHA